MTLPVFTPFQARRDAQIRASAGDAFVHVGRIFRRSLGRLCEIVLAFLAYRAALKRLEAQVGRDLFYDPVLWVDLKSVAWAEAIAVARDRMVRPSGVGKFR